MHHITYIRSQDDTHKITVLVQRKDDKEREKVSNHIPRYHRTRQMTIKESDIEGTSCLVITCSSMHFLQNKCPC